MDKRKLDPRLNKLLSQANKSQMLPGKSKGKLYSAKEAKAEREQRQKQKKKDDIVLNTSFMKPKKLTEHDYYVEQLKIYCQPLAEEQDTMQLQCVRYIVGPALDFPLNKIKMLFAWQKVKRHPLTNKLDDRNSYQVFLFAGDVGQELLEGKQDPVMLMWEVCDPPKLKYNDDNKCIGLVNNWEYLFDPDTEYEPEVKDEK